MIFTEEDSVALAVGESCIFLDDDRDSEVYATVSVAEPLSDTVIVIDDEDDEESKPIINATSVDLAVGECCIILSDDIHSDVYVVVTVSEAISNTAGIGRGEDIVVVDDDDTIVIDDDDDDTTTSSGKSKFTLCKNCNQTF